GGIVNHIIENERWFEEYVVHYTNAATILREDFRDTEEQDGYFSGWDPEQGRYDPTTWQYQGEEPLLAAAGSRPGRHTPGSTGGLGGQAQGEGERDPSLQHPRCVFHVLMRHFRRYTADLVERTCGVPRRLFLEVCESLCANSGRERTSSIVYSVGWTQHTTGVQMIRTAAIIQLLLGNIGRPGGGIM